MEFGGVVAESNDIDKHLHDAGLRPNGGHPHGWNRLRRRPLRAPRPTATSTLRSGRRYACALGLPALTLRSLQTSRLEAAGGVDPALSCGAAPVASKPKVRSVAHDTAAPDHISDGAASQPLAACRVCAPVRAEPGPAVWLRSCVREQKRRLSCARARAHPDLNQGPADLQSAALTTELCTRTHSQLAICPT